MIWSVVEMSRGDMESAITETGCGTLDPLVVLSASFSLVIGTLVVISRLGDFLVIS